MKSAIDLIRDEFNFGVINLIKEDSGGVKLSIEVDIEKEALESPARLIDQVHTLGKMTYAYKILRNKYEREKRIVEKLRQYHIFYELNYKLQHGKDL